MKSVFLYGLDELAGRGGLPPDVGGTIIGITEEDGVVTELFFGEKLPAAAAKRGDFTKAETPLIKKTAAQIEKYLAGKLTEFSVPLFMHGTGFQRDAWDALLTIPYGETRSYKQMAAQIGRPKAVRAVGMANNRNPVSIIVPCHRVIGHNGALVGYGAGLPLKRYLLALETRVAGGR